MSLNLFRLAKFLVSEEGRVLWTNSNLKSLNLAKFSFSGGYSGPTQTQSPNLSDKFHFWGGGGGQGTLDTTFLKYLSGGTQGILSTKFSKPNLLLIHRVSHTLCAWRLTRVGVRIRNWVRG